MGIIIGIDFGNISTKIGYVHDGIASAIKNKMFASEFTPTIIGLNEHINEIKFGKSAESFTSGVITELKKSLGNKEKKIKLGNTEYSPEELAGMFFKYLKDYGEDYLNDDITGAVISVPAGISDDAKRALDTASVQAGFKEIKLVKEPVSAILASGLDKDELDKLILVYDLGGTFNVSLISKSKKKLILEASKRINEIGGSQFDDKLVEHLKEHLKKQYGEIDIDEALEHKLRTSAKKAKEQLSNTETASTKIQFVAIVNGKVILFELYLAREKFNELIEPHLQETIKCMDEMISALNIDKRNITHILLTGGSTRIPLVREKVKAYSGREPFEGTDPELAACFGASIQAGILDGPDSIYWI